MIVAICLPVLFFYEQGRFFKNPGLCLFATVNRAIVIKRILRLVVT